MYAQPARPMNTIGAPTSPSTALIWRPGLEPGGVLRRGGRVDLLERDAERPVEVGVPQVREHVVVEDRLALGVGQERRLETGRGVELDLAVLERRVDVEEDRQPVIEAAPADAPLVDERAGARLGLLGGDAVVDELGVDDDLRRRSAPRWRRSSPRRSRSSASDRMPALS